MNSFEFYTPTKIFFGKNTEELVGEQLKKRGCKKVLIHYGGGSVVKSGLLDRVKTSLSNAGVSFIELGGVKPNPRLSLAQEGIELCRKEGVDFLLPVGGGSAIDSAKCIALGVPYDGNVWDIYERKSPDNGALPVACVLTLAATGSEMSTSSVITNEEGWLKKGYNSDILRPVCAFMNPELLYTLPPYQTACGVVDIMMHTFERYFSPGGANEMTDRIAEALLKTVMQFGVISYNEPQNYEARSEVMWAGSLSHNHLTGLGRKGDWACHQMEHEIGGMFDVAHGAGLAAVWGNWARYVCKQNPTRFARYGVNVLGLCMDYENPVNTALEAISATERFFKRIDMPICISELMGRTFTDDEIKELSVKCTYFGKRTIGGFMTLGEKEISEIYHMANH